MGRPLRAAPSFLDQQVAFFLFIHINAFFFLRTFFAFLFVLALWDMKRRPSSGSNQMEGILRGTTLRSCLLLGASLLLFAVYERSMQTYYVLFPSHTPH